MRLVREAPGRGVKVFIVGAGAAAHLGRRRRRAHDPAGDRRADRLVGAEGARRAAVDRADAAGRAGRDGVDRQAGRDERRRARRADPRRRRSGDCRRSSTNYKKKLADKVEAGGREAATVG